MRHAAGEGYRILLVDDHPAIRQGVGLLLAVGKHVIGGAVEDVAEARRCLEQGDIDLALVDLSLGDGSGLDLLAELAARDLPAVVYSMHEVPETIERAFQAGAQGYVTKREAPEVLLEAVATVMAGRRFVSPQAAQILARRTLPPTTEGAGRELSERESQILARLGRGEGSAEIAAALGIGSRTVETYCARIIEKLELSGMKALRKHAIALQRLL